jgi:ectoine hydroxylase-related dioxygenase (phytanoyl-CoA dioxygenase family)
MNKLITKIDTEEISWDCNFASASNSSNNNLTTKSKLLFNALPLSGWLVVDDPFNINAHVRESINNFLTSMFNKSFDINNYHNIISESEHYIFLDFARNLRFVDLSLNETKICNYFGDILNLKLHHVINKIGKDHLQIRTVRPGKVDFNPPHRDSYIDAFTDVVNIWIPIICEKNSSLPVISHSHMWDEKLIERSEIKSAEMGGNKYNVPAIFRYDTRNLIMTRPTVNLGQALVFTPYLVHGFGINNSKLTRFALELRLQIQ